jgi:AcrR family transcriptional regulator
MRALVTVVRTEGWSSATASRVAREAGVSRSGFYGHYANVDQLAWAVLDELMASLGMNDLLERKLPGTDGRALGRRSLQLLFESIIENRELYENVLLVDRGGRALAHAIDTFSNRTRPVVALARPEWDDPRVELAAAAIGGAIVSAVIHILGSDQARAPEAWAHDVMDVLPEWLYPDVR